MEMIKHLKYRNFGEFYIGNDHNDLLYSRPASELILTTHNNHALRIMPIQILHLDTRLVLVFYHLEKQMIEIIDLKQIVYYRTKDGVQQSLSSSVQNSIILLLGKFHEFSENTRRIIIKVKSEVHLTLPAYQLLKNLVIKKTPAGPIIWSAETMIHPYLLDWFHFNRSTIEIINA